MKNKSIFFLISFFIILLDQATKYLISKSMALSQSIPLIKNMLHITYVVNTGAGFGILKNMNTFLIWVTIIVIGILFYFYDSFSKDKLSQISLSLIVGGAFGNLLTRIFLGHVIDFIDFRVWPVFNVADSAVTIGAVLLIFCLWKK